MAPSLWPHWWDGIDVTQYLAETVSLLMKMLLSGSPSFHSYWQFPSISWTRPLLLDWPVGTSSAGCYASSPPPGPGLLSPAPLPWLCPIVALQTAKQTVNGGGRLVAGWLRQWLAQIRWRWRRSEKTQVKCLGVPEWRHLCLYVPTLSHQLLERQPSSAPSRRRPAPSPGRRDPAGSSTGRCSTAGRLVGDEKKHM